MKEILLLRDWIRQTVKKHGGQMTCGEEPGAAVILDGRVSGSVITIMMMIILVIVIPRTFSTGSEVIDSIGVV